MGTRYEMQAIRNLLQLSTQELSKSDYLNAIVCFLRDWMNSIPGLAYVADPHTYEILYANEALCETLGRDVVGERCYKALQGRQIPCDFCTNEIIIRTKDKPYQWEYHNPKLNRDFMIVDKIIQWPDGRDVRFEFAVDITERKAEESLGYLGFHDPLTGLHNRAYFEKEMLRLQSEGPSGVGVIVCDLDGLKLVNDTFGHAAGDALLVTVAGILKECVKAEDLVARSGGDEFVVFLYNTDLSQAENTCSKIRHSITAYNRKNPMVPICLSMGVAVDNGGNKHIPDLFKEADDNMYREKLHHAQSPLSGIVQTLMTALEARDFITEGHADRLQNLIATLAERLNIPQHKIADLRLFAQCHDIGKVGVPDHILFKPGKLNSDEVAIMRRHCEIGRRIAQSSPLLVPIADWILKHHEWWNGKGYPLGLKGKDIPLECRMLSIVDAYDAMTSDRPYRTAMTHDEAVKELRAFAGIQFDPDLVEQFVEIIECRIVNSRAEILSSGEFETVIPSTSGRGSASLGILLERFQGGEAMSQTAVTKSQEEVQVVVFTLGNEEFGTEISRVREIIRMTKITSLPDTADFIEGVINIRGEVVAVVDLRKRFSLNSESKNETRIILVDLDGSQVGLVVDSVSEVLRLPMSSIEPPPRIVAGLRSEFINGVGKLGERLIILLDLGKILSTEEKLELEAAVSR